MRAVRVPDPAEIPPLIRDIDLRFAGEGGPDLTRFPTWYFRMEWRQPS